MENDSNVFEIKTSAQYGGYDPKIFLKPVNQDFICSICNRTNKFDYKIFLFLIIIKSLILNKIYFHC